MKSFRYLGCSCRDNLTNDFVAAGRLPERLWEALIGNVIDDRPWIKDFCMTKSVSVIPAADLLRFQDKNCNDVPAGSVYRIHQ